MENAGIHAANTIERMIEDPREFMNCSLSSGKVINKTPVMAEIQSGIAQNKEMHIEYLTREYQKAAKKAISRLKSLLAQIDAR